MKFENGKIEARLNDLFFDVALVAMLKNIDHGMIYRAHHHMSHSCAFCAAQHGQTHLDLVARAAGSNVINRIDILQRLEISLLVTKIADKNFMRTQGLSFIALTFRAAHGSNTKSRLRQLRNKQFPLMTRTPEERHAGNECVSSIKSRWSPSN